MHERVIFALDSELDRRDDAVSVGDDMARVLLAAMIRQLPNTVNDPFGIYMDLLQFPPDYIQSIFNHLLTPDCLSDLEDFVWVH